MAASLARRPAGRGGRTPLWGYPPSCGRRPAAAEPSLTVIGRILSARGLDEAEHALRAAEAAMADPALREQAMRRYVRAEAEFEARGGYAAQAEAVRVAAGLGLPDRVMDQPLGTLSGGQRRRVELARVLFGGQGTLLLDEPTNNLDPASRDEVLAAIASYQGAVVMVAHDERAVDALRPGRVLLGVGDMWNSGYAGLVSPA